MNLEATIGHQRANVKDGDKRSVLPCDAVLAWYLLLCVLSVCLSQVGVHQEGRMYQAGFWLGASFDLSYTVLRKFWYLLK